jgi:PIN domain nuclease of toxin-antitoxin system
VPIRRARRAGRFAGQGRIADDFNAPLLLSAASSCEIAIKVALAKLELPAPPERFVPEQLAEDDIEALPITHAHALRSPASRSITAIRSIGSWWPRPISSGAL